MRSSVKRTILRWLVLFPAIVLPLTLGGVSPWFWSCVASVFLAGMLAYLWLSEPDSLKSIWPPKKKPLILLVFLLYPFSQIIPLPGFWIAILSPHRLLWIEAVQHFTGASHIWSSVSYSPLQSFFGGVWWLFLVCFGFCFRGLINEQGEYDRFVRTLFCVAAGEALYGIIQVLIPSLGVLWEQRTILGTAHKGCARGTFVNRSQLAVFMNLVWPLLVARLLTLGPKEKERQKGSLEFVDDKTVARQKKVFLGFLIFLIILSVLFSRSRAGIIGLLIAFSLFALLGGFLKKKLILIIAVCWIAILAYGSMIGYEATWSRFERASDDIHWRLGVWKDATAILRDHLLTGTGLDSYGFVAPVYREHLSDTTRAVHVHNDYLEMSVELGIPIAGGIFLFVWFYWWKQAIRLWRWRTRLAPEIRLRAAGAVSGGGAFLCHSWFDFNAEIPAILLYAVMIFIVMGVSSGEMRINRP